MGKSYVYIVECADGSLYTGVTQNVQRRLNEHNTNNRLGSKYIRARRPAKLVYKALFTSTSDALRREAEIKGWSRKEKYNLIKSR